MDDFAKLGANAFAKMEKVNSELLALTYGSIVSQLIKDIEFTEGVNTQLVSMGKNIGVRLVDEVLAKLGCTPCSDFRTTVEAIAKVGLKMFLGITGEVIVVDEANNRYNISFQENPLDQFVEIPENLAGLAYSNIICGVIIGALEQLQIKVKCEFVKDMLKGHDAYEISIKLDSTTGADRE
ncbi:Trafficking protein particle complex subunit 3 [Babesia sp. Xinjiang]|uniref:Trafficking protein particle complex subunit 3 n=1 Tax=Babesia sp. Xinjiang TaxID=462227 RepID=UPI000A24F9A7|nr:Trafficking protein particle complex subunit 3 [Babesia sp. Xinjiang]ORM39824.1 Trafficking protein particle complex subunit 3 [Babesia sp. Xinjiang]